MAREYWSLTFLEGSTLKCISVLAAALRSRAVPRMLLTSKSMFMCAKYVMGDSQVVCASTRQVVACCALQGWPKLGHVGTDAIRFMHDDSYSHLVKLQGLK